MDDALLSFWNRRTELTIEQGCLLWGIQVVIYTTKVKRSGIEGITQESSGYRTDEINCQKLGRSR